MDDTLFRGLYSYGVCCTWLCVSLMCILFSFHIVYRNATYYTPYITEARGIASGAATVNVATVLSLGLFKRNVRIATTLRHRSSETEN